MLGAIVGDIVGSRYEFSVTAIKTKDFPLFSPESGFTDDSVLTVAVAEALLEADGDQDRGDEIMAASMRHWARAFPNPPAGGYGGRFSIWARTDAMAPYNSFGNGSAMRVSPVGWYFSTMQETLRWAEISARVSHNHPEGIKAAQATASAIFMARGGQTKVRIRQEIEAAFGYNLSQTLDSIRPGYHHDVTAAGSVPQAIIAFLESDGFEDAIRNAVSLGGDSDTQGAIAGSIAEAAYGIPASIRTEALARLAPPMLGVVDRWESALARRESV